VGTLPMTMPTIPPAHAGRLDSSAARFGAEHPSVSFGDDGDAERPPPGGGGGGGVRDRTGNRRGGSLAPEVERYGLESSSGAATAATPAGEANNGKANGVRKGRLAKLGDTILGKTSHRGGGSGSLKATAMVTKAQKNGKHVRGNTGMGMGGMGIGGMGRSANNGVGSEDGSHEKDDDDDERSWLPSWRIFRRPPPRDVDLDDRIWHGNDRHPMDDGDYDDDGDYGHLHWRAITRWKRGVAVVFVIATMTVGSAVIGFAIPKEESALESEEGESDIGAAVIVSPQEMKDKTTTDKTITTTTTEVFHTKITNHTDEELLQIAQEVTQKCDVSNLKQMKGRQECQTLCHQHLCCFDEDATDGYNCAEDENKLCGVYAGCEALVVDESTVVLDKEMVVEMKLEDGDGDDDNGDENDEATGEGVDAEEEYLETDESDLADADEKNRTNGVGNLDVDTAKDESKIKVSDESESESDASKSETDNDENAEQTNEKEDENAEETEVTKEQELLEIAESISNACGASSLVTETGRLKCEHLCNDHFCCFDTENSCVDDEEEMCMVYVSCADLFEEVSMR